MITSLKTLPLPMFPRSIWRNLLITHKKIFILVVCCDDLLETANFVIFTYKEYCKIKNQQIINIKLSKSNERFENTFIILKDRKTLFRLERNRIEKDLLTIVDAI